MRRLLVAILTAATLPLGAQWILSVMAGYVPYAEGEVFIEGEVVRPKASDLLHIPEGGRLRTAHGRAEIMITPASYLRVGSNAELRLIEAGLLSAAVVLEAGAAVLDLSPGLEPGAVQVVLGETQVVPTKGGLYRFEAGPDARVLVLEGRAEVGGKAVKPNRTFHLAEAWLEKPPDVEPDGLDRWSRSRSDILAAALLKRREEGGDMSELERFWLGMTLRRPRPQPPSQPAPRERPPVSRR